MFEQIIYKQHVTYQNCPFNDSIFAKLKGTMTRSIKYKAYIDFICNFLTPKSAFKIIKNDKAGHI